MSDTLRDQVAAALRPDPRCRLHGQPREGEWSCSCGEETEFESAEEHIVRMALAAVPALSVPGGLAEALVKWAEGWEGEQPITPTRGGSQKLYAIVEQARAVLAQRAPERSELRATEKASSDDGLAVPAATPGLAQALAERLGEFERIATRIASLNNERSLGHASGIREVVDNLRLLLRDAALARADGVTYAEEADSEPDAERADAALDAALAQRAPERSEVDVERLARAIHNDDATSRALHEEEWAGNVRTWPCRPCARAAAAIVIEYARLAAAEQGAACICTPTVDGGHRAFCPARLQGEQE